MDHVDHFAGVSVYQQNIVIIANPAVGSVNFWQAVGPWIVDPIAAAEEDVAKMEADVDAAVPIVPIRCIIAT
ncbi:hypothetical protein GCM10023115_21530 [Pontixanthobacter gangjinensis]